MTAIGKISVRPLSELVCNEDEQNSENALLMLSNIKKSPSTLKKEFIKEKSVTTPKKTAKTTQNSSSPEKKPRTGVKAPLPGQMKIDNFFKSAAKTFKIEPKNEYEIKATKSSIRRRANKRLSTNKKPETKPRRKKVSSDDESTITNVSKSIVAALDRKMSKLKPGCVIDLCTSDSENEKDNTGNRLSTAKITSPIRAAGTAVNMEELMNSNVAAKRSKKQLAKSSESPIQNSQCNNKSVSLTRPASQPSAMDADISRPITRRMSARCISLGAQPSAENQWNFTTDDDDTIAAQSRVQLRSSTRVPNSYTTISDEINKYKKSPPKKMCEIPLEAIDKNGNILKGNAESSYRLKISQSSKLNTKSKSKINADVKVVKSENAAATISKRNINFISETLTTKFVNQLNDINLLTPSTTSARIAIKRKSSEEQNVKATASELTSRKKSKSLTNSSMENAELMASDKTSHNKSRSNTNSSQENAELITSDRKDSKKSKSSLNSSTENAVSTSSDQKGSKKSKSNTNSMPENAGRMSGNKSKSSINSMTENVASTTSKKSVKATFDASTPFSEIIDISDDERENVDVRMTKKKPRKTTKAKEPPAPKPKRPKRVCPPYKIVEGTTFAVDAFQYGSIEGVTHYFLTHFHADHYVGLSGKFEHDIYMSPITARLVGAFIPVKKEFIHEIELNEPIVVNGVEITAIDANHCPGAIMLIFKTKDGECILHTGDFRANPQMESEPIFWNNDIHTIYLDTTYIAEQYSFCDQSESIDRATQLIEEFREKNVGTRVLYVCGSYLVGKEKFWSAIAKKFSFQTWIEGKRRQALLAINDTEMIDGILAECPEQAQLHIISMVHMGYNHLVQYLEKYAEHFDVIFAIRPSGWERGNKPQYRGKINIIGIEYSEHSSHEDLRRFVRYLRPLNVISTVPSGANALITPKIPREWYMSDKRQFQPSITSFFKLKPENFPTAAKSDEETATAKALCDKSIPLTALMTVSPEKDGELNNSCDVQAATPPAQKESVPEKKLNGMRKDSVAKIKSRRALFVNDANDDDWLT